MYKKLVSDIEAVFTVEALEKKPATTDVEQVGSDQVKMHSDTVSKLSSYFDFGVNGAISLGLFPTVS